MRKTKRRNEPIFKKYFEGLEIKVHEKHDFAFENEDLKYQYERTYWLVTMTMTKEHPFSAPQKTTCRVVRPKRRRAPGTRSELPDMVFEIKEQMVLLDIVYDLRKNNGRSCDFIQFKFRSIFDRSTDSFALFFYHTTKQRLLLPPPKAE